MVPRKDYYVKMKTGVPGVGAYNIDRKLNQVGVIISRKIMSKNFEYIFL
jgi:hypothetical protein